MASRARIFAAWRSLSGAGAKPCPEVPITFFDERFTSVLAHQAILDGGVKKKTRRENKGLVDQVSATIILQDYMRAQGL